MTATTQTIAAKSEALLHAERYLRNEVCFRVELTRPWGPNGRVVYVEAVDGPDAARCCTGPGGPAVVSVRRAVEADAAEMLAMD